MMEILRSLTKKEIVLGLVALCFCLTTLVLSIICIVRSKREKKLYEKFADLKLEVEFLIRGVKEELVKINTKETKEETNTTSNTEETQESSQAFRFTQGDKPAEQKARVNLMRRH